MKKCENTWNRMSKSSRELFLEQELEMDVLDAVELKYGTWKELDSETRKGIRKKLRCK
jgi:hypothetical protein